MRLFLRGHKSNPITILERAHYMFYYSSIYNKNANIISSIDLTSHHFYEPEKKISKTTWELPSANCLNGTLIRLGLLIKKLASVA